MTARQRTYHLLDPADGISRAEWWINLLLTVMIILTVASTMLATLPNLTPGHRAALRAFELTAFVIFAAEYAARLWVVPERRAARGQAPQAGQYLRYALSPLPLIDLIVLLSLLTPVTMPVAALRGLRFLKLIGILKLGRYSDALQIIGQTLRARSGELAVLGLIVTVLIFIAASVLYYTESRLGTPCFESIPHAMWWAVVTLSTTGYGDCYPKGTSSKIAAGAIMLLGVGLVALPAGIIASGFTEAMTRHRAQLDPARFTHRVAYLFPTPVLLTVSNSDEAQAHLDAWTRGETHLHRDGNLLSDLTRAPQVRYLPPGETL